MLAQKLLPLLATSVAIVTVVTCILMYPVPIGRTITNLHGSVSCPADNHPLKEQRLPQTWKIYHSQDLKNSSLLKEGLQVQNLGDRHKNTTFKIPHTENYNCSDAICSEFIPSKQYFRSDNCRTNGSKKLKGNCHFKNGTNSPPIALASYPGSGNTWIRGLLEQATGICTGSLYCDESLRAGGFNGEGYRSGAVLVVKTHYLPSQRPPGPPWGPAIFIIRDPRDALVAEWKRKISFMESSATSHVQNIGKNFFGNNSEWEQFIKEAIGRWATLFEWVYHRKNKPVLIIKYESIKTNASNEVEKMLTFLSVPFSRESLKKRMSEGFESFHRAQTKEYEYFTSKQKEYVRQQVESVISLLKTKNNGDTLGIEEYLEPTMEIP